VVDSTRGDAPAVQMKTCWLSLSSCHAGIAIRYGSDRKQFWDSCSAGSNTAGSLTADGLRDESSLEVSMEAPLVSVIIITWNRREDVLETIQSIYDQAYRNFEVIVVDNGSTDGTVEALRRAYPAVRVLALGRNTGVGGRNAGIRSARGDIIFCLDSDASLSHDTLTQIVRKLQARPDVGIINSKIVNAYTRELDRTAGWVYTEKDKADQDVEFLSYNFSEGGCAIRKKVFDQVGLFWEALFFGCEGQEFSLRVWDAGYKILYCPQAIVYHRASPQQRMIGGERDYFFLRNALYIYAVHYPWWMLIFFAPLKIGVSLFRGARKGYSRQVLRALVDVARQFPSLYKHRRPISSKTARRYLDLQRQHGPLRWDLVSWLRYKT
jgi:GT2 family glycosyltransferase